MTLYKSRSREKYLVTEVEGQHAWVQKMIGKCLRARKYRVKLVDVIIVPTKPIYSAEFWRKSKFESKDTIPKSKPASTKSQKVSSESPNRDSILQEESSSDDEYETYSSVTFHNSVTVPNLPVHNDTPQRMVRPRRTVRRPQFLQYYARGSTIPLPDVDSDELATPEASVDDSDFITPESSEIDSEELVTPEAEESDSSEPTDNTNSDVDNSASEVVPVPVPPDPGEHLRRRGTRRN